MHSHTWGKLLFCGAWQGFQCAARTTLKQILLLAESEPNKQHLCSSLTEIVLCNRRAILQTKQTNRKKQCRNLFRNTRRTRGATTTLTTSCVLMRRRGRMVRGQLGSSFILLLATVPYCERDERLRSPTESTSSTGRQAWSRSTLKGRLNALATASIGCN